MLRGKKGVVRYLELADQIRELLQSYEGFIPERGPATLEHVAEATLILVSSFSTGQTVSNLKKKNDRAVHKRQARAIEYLRQGLLSYLGNSARAIDIRTIAEQADRAAQAIRKKRHIHGSLEDALATALQSKTYADIGKDILNGADKHKQALGTNTGRSKHLAQEYTIVVQELYR
ncbi:MAG: hypothetical protein V1725_02870 [archaeon]